MVGTALVMVLLACSSDNGVRPDDNGGSTARSDGLSLVADSVIGVGDTLHWKVVRTSAAGLVTDSNLTRSSSVAVSDSTVLRSFVSSLSLIGAAPGTITLSTTLSPSPLPVTAVVRVRENRPTIAVSLGQTVTGKIVRNFGTERYSLSLAAGDTVDFMSEGLGVLRSLDTRKLIPLTISSDSRRIYAVVVAPRSGTYDVDVIGYRTCSTRGLCADANGDYTLKVRRSAPVFNLVNSFRGMQSVPSGGSAVDSFYVQNVGAGTLKVRAEAVTSALSVETAEVVANGPTQPASFSSIPTDATPIVVRLGSKDLPGTPQGSQGVRMSVDSSTWSLFPGNATTRYLQLFLYDPAITIMSPQAFDNISVPSSGPMYAIVGPLVCTFDLRTGDVRIIRSGSRRVKEVWASDDGKVYLHYDLGFATDTISRLNADGSLTTIFGFTDRNLAVMTVRDDGTMYVAQGGTLQSRSPEGVLTTLATGIAPQNGAMAYSAIENALYYVTSGELRRFDLTASRETTRGGVDASLRLSAVDKTGRLVGFTQSSAFVFFLDTNGKVVATVAPPAQGFTAVVRGDILYGSGPGSTNYVWKRSIP